MPIGPGKYDPECFALFTETEANTVIVAVVGWKRGNGFSVNTSDPDGHTKIPAMLRLMADQIEASTS